MATHQVLSTIELAELILSYLPFQDLISSSRVCHLWNNLIKTSPHTQPGLFLAPVSRALSLPYQSNSKIRKPWQYRSLNIKRYTETYTIAVLHPYLVAGGEGGRRGRIEFTFDWEKALNLHSEGRWRKMYVTQPPCRNVKLEFEIWDGEVQYGHRQDRVSDPGGVRLGLLVDKIRELLVRVEGTHFTLAGLVGSGQLGVEGPRFERLECFVDGFISESAAFALASRAAAAVAVRDGSSQSGRR